jgi:hypothetical protein
MKFSVILHTKANQILQIFLGLIFENVDETYEHGIENKEIYRKGPISR